MSFLTLADIDINAMIREMEKVAVKMGDGILNSFQAPNFTYIRRKTVERSSSFGQA